MSTETQADSTVESQQRFEKNITMTVYADVDAEYDSEREFIADVLDMSVIGDEDEEIDPFETYENTTTDVSLDFNFEVEDPRWGDTREVTESWSPFGTSSRRFKKAIDDGLIDTSELDWVDATVEEVVEEKDQHDVRKLLKKSVRPAVESIPMDDMGYEAEDYVYGVYSWETEVPNLQPDADPGEMETLFIRINASRSDEIKQRRLLKPMGDRSRGDRFEDAPERWSFEIITDIEAESEQDLEMIEQAISGSLLDFFASLEGVDQTRLTECEVVTTEHGSCHSV